MADREQSLTDHVGGGLAIGGGFGAAAGMAIGPFGAWFVAGLVAGLALGLGVARRNGIELELSR